MKGKSIIFEKFFRSIRNDGKPLLDEEEASVASSVFDFAWNEINEDPEHSDYESDDSDTDSFDERAEEAIIKVERVAEVFKKSSQAKDNFLRSFDHWAAHCKKAIQSLRD
ncbi:hypothetical protein AVEN_127666-1, partial [Araneus ventricosus]